MVLGTLKVSICNLLWGLVCYMMFRLTTSLSAQLDIRHGLIVSSLDLEWMDGYWNTMMKGWLWWVGRNMVVLSLLKMDGWVSVVLHYQRLHNETPLLVDQANNTVDIYS